MKKEDLKKEMGMRLMQARQAAGYKKRPEVIERFGWNANTFKSHEYGMREIDRDYAKIYSDAFGVPVEHLLALDLIEVDYKDIDMTKYANITPSVTPLVPIYGESAGGVWREGEDVPFDQHEVKIPAHPGFPYDTQYARRVVGNSISNRIRDGDYAIMVHYNRAPSSLVRPGRLVDVQRLRSGLREHSIKVYVGNNRLMTDSRELDVQEELKINHSDMETEVQIVGVVISSYRSQV